MKKYVVLLFCMIFSIIALGQEQRHEFEEVEVTPPMFMGIENAVEVLDMDKVSYISISQHLSEEFTYPEEGGFFPYEGVEVVQFTVTTKGELTNFKIINSIGEAVDEEIVGILKATNGMWKPGLNNGEPVAMEKEVAMKILTGETDGVAIYSYRDFEQTAKHSFKRGSLILFEKGNAKKALRHYNKGVQYSPFDKNLLLMRGLCRYELGNTNGAREDWIRLKELGGIEMEPAYFALIKNLKGFEELAFMFLKE